MPLASTSASRRVEVGVRFVAVTLSTCGAPAGAGPNTTTLPVLEPATSTLSRWASTATPRPFVSPASPPKRWIRAPDDVNAAMLVALSTYTSPLACWPVDVSTATPVEFSSSRPSINGTPTGGSPWSLSLAISAGFFSDGAPSGHSVSKFSCWWFMYKASPTASTPKPGTPQSRPTSSSRCAAGRCLFGALLSKLPITPASLSQTQRIPVESTASPPTPLSPSVFNRPSDSPVELNFSMNALTETRLLATYTSP